MRIRVQFLPQSMYGWLILFLGTLSLTLLVFVAWVIFSLSNNYLEDVTTRCGKRMATLINQTIRKSMMTEDHSEVGIALSNIVEIPGVSSIRIYNNSGIIKHHSMDSARVHDDMLPCENCHSAQSPDVWGMATTCIYTKAMPEGRSMVILSPILSTPSCSSYGCHQTHKDKDLLGFMEITLPLQELDTALNTILVEYFILVFLFLIILLTVLLMFFNNRINQPLRQIVKVSKAVTAGNMSMRVNVGDNQLADIHQVELAINTMLESIASNRLELQKWSSELETQVRTKTEDMARTHNEIYHIERLASLGRLSSSVAHEINNPLAGILTYAKLISRMLRNGELNDERRDTLLRHLEMIESETARCGDIVKGLLDFSREEDSSFEPVSLNLVLRETQALIQHSFQISDVRLVTDFSASHDRISGNMNQLIQACLAVLTNAMEAVPEDGTGAVTYRSYNPDLRHVIVEIRDNGIGISPEDQKHIFEPFFSSKKEMSGIGLGLAVTYGILEQHQAKVSVDSSPGNGTTMKFIFELEGGH